MRLAVLSDVHGNLPALEAVLADLQAQGAPDAIWVLGDLVAFCPWPNQTLACLRALPEVAFVQGNTDRYLVTGRRPLIPVRSPDEWARMAAFLEVRDALFRWTVERLSWEDYGFLRDLPVRVEQEIPGYGSLLGVHAAPGDDEANLLAETPDEAIRPYLGGVDGRLLVYGHTHRPLERVVDGVRLVNVGSVGLPLDGHPRPAYGLFDFQGRRCQVAIRRVEYDLQAVIAELERVQHPAQGWVWRMLVQARI